jgi:hypothetical protein
LAEAAQAYYDAATLLLEQGEFDAAEALLPAIAEGSAVKAYELGQQVADDARDDAPESLTQHVPSSIQPRSSTAAGW